MDNHFIFWFAIKKIVYFIWISFRTDNKHGSCCRIKWKIMLRLRAVCILTHINNRYSYQIVWNIIRAIDGLRFEISFFDGFDFVVSRWHLLIFVSQCFHSTILSQIIILFLMGLNAFVRCYFNPIQWCVFQYNKMANEVEDAVRFAEWLKYVCSEQSISNFQLLDRNRNGDGFRGITVQNPSSISLFYWKFIVVATIWHMLYNMPFLPVSSSNSSNMVYLIAHTLLQIHPVQLLIWISFRFDCVG